MRISRAEKDYEAFCRVLEETPRVATNTHLRLRLAAESWHLVLWPERNGDLSRFMQWMANTHTQRWQRAKLRVGYGHL